MCNNYEYLNDFEFQFNLINEFQYLIFLLFVCCFFVLYCVTKKRKHLIKY